MSYARYGFIRATDGLYDARFWGSLAALLAFTAAAVIASTVIYNARRSGAATELAKDRVGEQPLSPTVR